MLKSLPIFALLALSALSYGDIFPAPIEKCHMNDEKCLVEQAYKFLQVFRPGIPELNIPVLEPLSLDKISIMGDPKQSTNIELMLMDVKMHKFTHANVTSLNGFSKDTSKPMKIYSTSFTPQLTIKAKYKIGGKILILPITGEGDLEWNLIGVNMKSKTTLKPEERDGEIYMNIIEQKILAKMDNVKIQMSNLFNGDKALSDNMLKLINENWELLSEDVQPKINEALSAVQINIFHKLFKNIPYKLYFLPDDA